MADETTCGRERGAETAEQAVSVLLDAAATRDLALACTVVEGPTDKAVLDQALQRVGNDLDGVAPAGATIGRLEQLGAHIRVEASAGDYEEIFDVIASHDERYFVIARP